MTETLVANSWVNSCLQRVGNALIDHDVDPVVISAFSITSQSVSRALVSPVDVTDNAPGTPECSTDAQASKPLLAIADDVVAEDVSWVGLYLQSIMDALRERVVDDNVRMAFRLVSQGILQSLNSPRQARFTNIVTAPTETADDETVHTLGHNVYLFKFYNEALTKVRFFILPATDEMAQYRFKPRRRISRDELSNEVAQFFNESKSAEMNAVTPRDVDLYLDTRDHQFGNDICEIAIGKLIALSRYMIQVEQSDLNIAERFVYNSTAGTYHHFDQAESYRIIEHDKHGMMFEPYRQDFSLLTTLIKETM